MGRDRGITIIIYNYKKLRNCRIYKKLRLSLFLFIGGEREKEGERILFIKKYYYIKINKNSYSEFSRSDAALV